MTLSSENLLSEYENGSGMSSPIYFIYIFLLRVQMIYDKNLCLYKYEGVLSLSMKLKSWVKKHCSTLVGNDFLLP